MIDNGIWCPHCGSGSSITEDTSIDVFERDWALWEFAVKCGECKKIFFVTPYLTFGTHVEAEGKLKGLEADVDFVVVEP